MTEYHFMLIALAEPDDATDEAIYGRCDDSTIAHRDGVMRIIFDRQADSLEAAIASAVADVTGVSGLVIHHVEIPGTPDRWKKVG